METIQDMASRPMRVKILYTLDRDHATMYLARLSGVVDVPVVPDFDDGGQTGPLGLVDLATCLRAVHDSSPEIIAGPTGCDYAVYSVDFSEPDQPLVGHGLLSRTLLQPVPAAKQASAPIYLPGRITTNMLPLYSAKETLEVHLRMLPLADRSQPDYLTSLKLYEHFAKLLPADFNHGSWTDLLTKHNILAVIAAVSGAHKPAPTTSGSSSHFNHSALPSPEPSSSTGMSMAPMPIAPMPMSAASLQAPERLAKRQKSTPALPSRESPYPASSPPPSTSNSYAPLAPASHIQQHYLSHLSVSSPASSGPLMASRKLTVADKKNLPISNIDLPKSALPGSSGDEVPLAPLHIKEFKAVRSKKNRPANIERELQYALNNGEVPNFCDNCGVVKTTTWRRMTNGERDVLLCNPCGLWYHSKKTMRPSNLWSSNRTKSKEKAAADSDPASSIDWKAVRQHQQMQKQQAQKQQDQLKAADKQKDAPRRDTNEEQRISGSDKSATAASRRQSYNIEASRAASLAADAGAVPANVHHPSSSGAQDSSASNFSGLVLPTGGVRSSPPRSSSVPAVSASQPQADSVHIHEIIEIPNTPPRNSPGTKAGRTATSQDSQDNKENMPPAEPLRGMPSTDIIVDADIESLFATPRRSGSQAGSTHGSVTSSTSKWMSKFIHGRPDDDDVFKAFLESPSKRALGSASGIGGNADYNSVVSAMAMDTSTSMGSGLNSDSMGVPSSPPSSFFYLYDQNSPTWNKQWSTPYATGDSAKSTGSPGSDAKSSS